MLVHVVIFSWVPDVSNEQIKHLRQQLDGLALQVADLASIQHGPDLLIREGNGDYALIANFADRAGWDEYQQHPAHKTFVRDVVTPLMASRLTIQFQGDPQP